MCFGDLNDTALAIIDERVMEFLTDPHNISHIVGHLHSFWNTFAIAYIFLTWPN